MLASEIQEGDEFWHEGAYHYKVVKTETITHEGEEFVQLTVQYSDGGMAHRHFYPDDDVPMKRS